MPFARWQWVHRTYVRVHTRRKHAGMLKNAQQGGSHAARKIILNGISGARLSSAGSGRWTQRVSPPPSTSLPRCSVSNLGLLFGLCFFLHESENLQDLAARGIMAPPTTVPNKYVLPARIASCGRQGDGGCLDSCSRNGMTPCCLSVCR